MRKKLLKATIVTLAVTIIAVTGCSPQQAPPTQATDTTAVNTVSKRVDDIVKKGLYRFGPPMMGVADSFDNMYFAAKGGNWALASYMGDVIDDFMGPTELTKPQLHQQFEGFYKANLGDGTPIRKAMDAKDFASFDKAYGDIITGMCNTCHASNGFKFIQKLRPTMPPVSLDYSVKSDTSESK